MKRSVHGTKMLFIGLYLLYGMERRTIFEAGYQRMKLLRTREYFLGCNNFLSRYVNIFEHFLEEEMFHARSSS